MALGEDILKLIGEYVKQHPVDCLSSVLGLAYCIAQHHKICQSSWAEFQEICLVLLFLVPFFFLNMTCC